MEQSELNNHLPFIWPEPLIENFNDKDWPQLHLDDDSIEKWVIDNKKLLVRVVTWNLCANPPPSINDISNYMLPKNKFHVYAIGTEECERSIAQSAINPSKKSWEAFLMDAVGPNYVPIRSHTLQAIHLMLFVHKRISHLCSVVTSAAVPTGIASTLGNKGGVGVYFKIASTTVLIVNAHLAAHQSAELRRNAEFNRINRMIPMLLEKKEQSLKDDALRVLLKQRSRSSKLNSIKSKSTSGQYSASMETILDTKDNDIIESVSENKLQIGTNINENVIFESNEKPLIDTNIVDNASNNDMDRIQAVSVSVGKIKPNRILICTNNIAQHQSVTKEISTIDINSNSSSIPNQILASNESNEVVETEHQELRSNIQDKQSNTIDNLTNNTNNLNNDVANKELPSNNHLIASLPVNSLLEVQVLPIEQPQQQEIVLIEEDSILDSNKSQEDFLEIDPKALKTLDEIADFVVFMGDLNYRIKGNRKMISSLISNNMHDVLINNDQLKYNMSKQLVLQNFTEPPLNFKPTYKYDIGTNQYDTSKKRRIPSWTDRILYVPNNELVICIGYNSIDEIKTSDHRPVYASFILAIESFEEFNQFDKFSSSSSNNNKIMVTSAKSNNNNNLFVSQSDKIIPKFTSESQVCSIM